MRWIHKFVVLVMLLLGPILPAADAAPNLPPMPTLESPVLAGESEETFCEGAFATEFEYWDVADTPADAVLPKYIVVRLVGDPNPVIIVVIEDQTDPEAVWTIYIDYNGDGFVDRQTSSSIKGCEEITKAVAARKKRA